MDDFWFNVRLWLLTVGIFAGAFGLAGYLDHIETADKTAAIYSQQVNAY
jgi:uncharacterized membrane protein